MDYKKVFFLWELLFLSFTSSSHCSSSRLFSCRHHISVIQCFRLFTALLCLLDTQIYTPRQLSANPHTSAIHKLISHTPKLTLAVYSSLSPITSFSHMSEWPYVITFHTSLCSSQVAWLLSQPPVAIYLLLPLVEDKVMKPRLLLDYAFWIFSVHVLLPPCLFVFRPKSYLSYMKLLKLATNVGNLG